jgi:hypothetical protein
VNLIVPTKPAHYLSSRAIDYDDENWWSNNSTAFGASGSYDFRFQEGEFNVETNWVTPGNILIR